MSSVYIAKSRGKGRGVFAGRMHYAGHEILLCPVLVAPSRVFGGPLLIRYAFEWGHGRRALALGEASFLNHSYSPNAMYEPKGEWILVTALRDINCGEEVTVNYNGDADDQTPFPGLPKPRRRR